MDEVISGSNVTHALGWLDLAVLAAAIAVLFGIAWLTGRKESDTQDFFLGKRSVPPVVACLSFVAAEVSAVTIVSVPGIAFHENWQYLQFFVGSAAARVCIAFLFIPVFYRFNCTTIYEFLKHRFGDGTRYAGSVFFFLTRLIGSGVRLYAASLGISVILDCSIWGVILGFTVVSIVFIAFGGIKAVVWTGAFEAVMFYLAGAGVATYLLLQIPGGASQAWDIAGEAGKLSLWNLDLSLADPKTLWAAALSAFFVNMSVFGTDQDFMQKMLTVKTRRSSQNALLATIVAGLLLVCTYMVLGTLLFAYYKVNPDPGLPADGDKLLSHFTVNVLPAGLKGLILTAIVLASIDSPLSSLSASFVTDIYRPLINRTGTERHYLWIGRFGVVAFGLVLAGLAYACEQLKDEGILWVAFQVLGVTGGSTLGVFLLGLLTKRHANRANVVAMTVSAAAMAVLLYLSKSGTIGLGWSWLIVIGTVSTFVIGYVLGPVLDRSGPTGSAGFAVVPAEASAGVGG